MSAALELVLRATVLIGAAWAAAALLRMARVSAATRHMAWLLGVAALLALPLIWWLAPPLRLPVLAPEAMSEPLVPFVPVAGAAPPAAAAGPGWDSLFLIVYLVGTAAMLLRFVLSRRLVSNLWRNAESAQAGAWQDLLARTGREMRLSRPVQLRIARGAAEPIHWGPMTWGTLTPRILLPAEAHSWPAGQRRLVLLHELAHVARRDSLSRSAAALACALYWFHPGAWFAARRLRLEQEHAADDRVLSTGAPARGYARSLLDLALRVGGKRSPGHAAAMAGMCQLERRVLSITSSAHRERPGHAFLSASVAIGTCVMLAVATAIPVRPLPVLSDPAWSENARPEAPAMQAPGEPAVEPGMQTATRAAIAPPANEAAENVRSRLEAPGVTPPPAAEARAPVTQSQQLSQALQPAAEATSAPTMSLPPAPPPRLAVYGPQLPQPLPAERDSDPRIPAALRRGNRERSVDRRAGPGPPRNQGEELLRTVPSALLQAAGILRPS